MKSKDENDEMKRYRKSKEIIYQLDRQSDINDARRQGKKEMEQYIQDCTNKGMLPKEIINLFNSYLKDCKKEDKIREKKIAALTFENTYLEEYKNILEKEHPKKIQEIINYDSGIALFDKLYMEEIRETLNDKTKQEKIIKDHKAQIAYDIMLINENRKGKKEVMNLYKKSSKQD